MTVRWAQAALDRLTEIYVSLNLEGQRELTRRVEWINDMLGRDPEALGESREPGRRIWFAKPLAVTFRISGGQVLVTNVVMIRG